jgi:hypothetical protein
MPQPEGFYAAPFDRDTVLPRTSAVISALAAVVGAAAVVNFAHLDIHHVRG